MLSPATAVMLDIRRTLGLPKLEEQKKDEMMIRVFKKKQRVKIITHWCEPSAAHWRRHSPPCRSKFRRLQNRKKMKNLSWLSFRLKHHHRVYLQAAPMICWRSWPAASLGWRSRRFGTARCDPVWADCRRCATPPAELDCPRRCTGRKKEEEHKKDVEVWRQSIWEKEIAKRQMIYITTKQKKSKDVD